MKAQVKYLASVASLTLALLGALPAQATSFDVAFYELTEEAQFIFDDQGNFVKRTGSGSLAGQANLGTPLCPTDLVVALVTLGQMNAGTPCYVTATGSDVIRADGTGRLEATIQVKVQGDNPVDAPELVVMVAGLVGSLLAADPGMRLLAMEGTLTTTHLLDPETFGLVEIKAPGTPFTGMVRLPFVVEPDGKHRKARRHERAFYLSDDGGLIRVKQAELSLGRATARFELNFPHPPD